ncbi:MAG: 2-hydroxyacyl-CoA dehydratase [Deltaproteobacteria bacterium]|nr:2-hydroxyacyl-CoA dehydratase [Deltaproteobacteria bacterium]
MIQKTKEGSKLKTEQWQGERSKKRLKTSQEASGLMKKSNEEMLEGIARGGHLIFGDGPRELIRSMGLYYHCHAWWSAVFAAKQMDRHYHDVLKQKGYFNSLAGGYESITLGYALDNNPKAAPYGGIPKISAWIIDRASSTRVYEHYAREFGCPLYFMDFTHPTNIPSRWWEIEDWGNPPMVEQWTKEFEGCARFLEALTGKSYNEAKLREVLEIADETCEYYWKATDLACTTVPAPISVTDAFAEVAVYNWHQGEKWTLEHAKQYYEEIKKRVDNKEAVCPNEKVRLLWLTTLPIWFSLGFYNYWEESHGAVFIADNYISAAAKIMYHDRSNPLKAMALRRHLRYGAATPTAAAEYAVHTVEKCKADGVILPIRGGTAYRGEMFILETLKRHGTPTLIINYDPVDSQNWDDSAMKAKVTVFIESLKPFKNKNPKK